MSDGMNKVILLGNVGANPELRYTTAGVPVLSLRLATNESYLDKNKEPQGRTEWHTVVVWGARAEGLARVLTRGAGVLVEGTLRTSSYEKDGQKRYRTEVHAREICFAGKRGVSPGGSDELPLGADEPAPGRGPGRVDAGVGGLGLSADVSGFVPPRKPVDPLDELPY